MGVEVVEVSIPVGALTEPVFLGSRIGVALTDAETGQNTTVAGRVISIFPPDENDVITFHVVAREETS